MPSVFDGSTYAYSELYEQLRWLHLTGPLERSSFVLVLISDFLPWISMIVLSLYWITGRIDPIVQYMRKFSNDDFIIIMINLFFCIFYYFCMMLTYDDKFRLRNICFCMSKKSWLNLYSNLLYEMGEAFLDGQYVPED